MPKELLDIATSITINNAKKNSTELLCSSIINELEKLYKLSSDEWINQWNYNCAHNKSIIELHEKNNLYKGTFLGLSLSGEAIVKINGKPENFKTGIIQLI